jgi:phosphoribosylglycinamide formyltransferase 1
MEVIMEDAPRILVFASGGKNPNQGGSGFETLVWNTSLNPPILDAEIVGVVSNHESGGVKTKADKLGISFECFKGPYYSENYQKVIKKFSPDFIILSGWIKMFFGFDPKKTINIHPGPLPYTAGKYGHHVHEAVLEAYKKGEITQSAVTMHFVNEKYDDGPKIVEWPVFIKPDDTAETLAKRVNEIERVIQSYYLNLVVHDEIWVSEKGKVHHNI